MAWFLGTSVIAALAVGLLALNWTWRVAWRAIVVYSVMLSAGLLLSGPLRSASHDPLGDVGNTYLMLALTLPFLAFGLRCLCRPFLQDPPDAGLPIDSILWALLGAAAALQVFALAAMAFGGFDRPVLAHVLIMIPALVALGVSMALPLVAFRYASGAAAITMGLAAFLSALWYPAFLSNQAERFAEGAPYCLMLQDRKREPARRLDLAFLTLDKNELLPHVTIHVRFQQDILRGYWSYYDRRFEPLNHAIAAVPCAP